MPIAALLGVAAGGAAWWYGRFAGIADDALPNGVWVWLGLSGLGLAVAALGFTTSAWWRRLTSVFAVLLCLLSSGVVLNRWVGYWPTAQVAWNDLTDAPLPHEVDSETMHAMQRAHMVPTHGTIVRLESGSDGSHFSHRQEYVYLPPAWYSSSPPPALPAVLMVGGEFARPITWLLGGGVYATIDSFAIAHNGFSPIFVFPDVTGWFRNDTECVNGPRGYVADHLTKDVVPSVTRQFSPSGRAANWGVVGWSMGGTCAVDLTVMHPDVFTSFIDIQGDQAPNAGNRQQTIQRLFGGDARAYESFDPLTVMQKHGPYNGVTGWFSVPSGPGVDAKTSRSFDRLRTAAEVLCGTGLQLGIACKVAPFHGSHAMQSGTLAFNEALPWLAGQLGTPGVDKVPLLSSAPLP